LERAGEGLGWELPLLVAVVLVEHGVLTAALRVVLGEVGGDHPKLAFHGRAELAEINTRGGGLPMRTSISAINEVVRQFRLLGGRLALGPRLCTLVQVLVAVLTAMLDVEGAHGGGWVRKDLLVFRMPISIVLLTGLRLLIRNELLRQLIE